MLKWPNPKKNCPLDSSTQFVLSLTFRFLILGQGRPKQMFQLLWVGPLRFHTPQLRFANVLFRFLTNFKNE